jgi:hypothetical protein
LNFKKFKIYNFKVINYSNTTKLQTMTISEMYQEIVEQEVADIFLDEDGYIIDDYSLDDTMQIEYDV